MVDLVSLPEDILTQIYILAGQQTRALLRLSRVNRGFREIWLKDSYHIIASVIRQKAPGHEDVMDLASLESRLPKRITGFHSFDPSEPHPPLRSCLPSLCRNITLATKVCSQFLKWNENMGRNGYPVVRPMPSVYYLIRQMAMAYHLPQLRPSLGEKLRTFAESDEALSQYCGLSVFIGSRNMPSILSRALGVKESFIYTEVDSGESYRPMREEWLFADQLGWKLRLDRDDGIQEDLFSNYYPDGGRKDAPPAGVELDDGFGQPLVKRNLKMKR